MVTGVIPSDQVPAQTGRPPVTRMNSVSEPVFVRRRTRPANRPPGRFIAAAALPAVVLVAGVTVIPMAFGVYLSFTNYSPAHPTFAWLGLANYRHMLHVPYVPVSIENTFVFAGLGLLVEVSLGLLFAVLLARTMRGVTIFRVFYILPLAVSPVAASAAWKALFNTEAGWVNYFSGRVHLPKPNWLADAHTAMPAVVTADAWTGVSVVTVILLGGLLSLNRAPGEAARIDGAGELRVLLYITIPDLFPVLGFAISLRLFDLLRQFGLFQLMTGGGPGVATNVLNFYVWQNSFASSNLGYGAALGVTLTLIILAPTAIALFCVRRLVKR